MQLYALSGTFAFSHHFFNFVENIYIIFFDNS